MAAPGPAGSERSKGTSEGSDGAVDDGREDLTRDHDSPPKKRRRTAKPNPLKKFECQHEGCGKSYSRAEHLYRHQLNHNPKNIYRCDFPDCNRSFVRQDLCVRHRERHTTQGSQLHKRDAFVQASASSTNYAATTKASPQQSPANDSEQDDHLAHLPPSSDAFVSDQFTSDMHMENGTARAQVHQRQLSNHAMSPSTTATNSNFQPPMARDLQRSSYTFPHEGVSANHFSATGRLPEVPNWQPKRMMSSQGESRSPTSAKPTHRNSFGASEMTPQSLTRTYSNSSASTNQHGGTKIGSGSLSGINGGNHGYVPPSDVSTIHFGNEFRDARTMPQQNNGFGDPAASALTSPHTDLYSFSGVGPSNPVMDVNTAYGYPILGGDELNRSPFTFHDEFAVWLFSDNQPGYPNISPSGVAHQFGENPISQAQGPFLAHSPSNNNPFQSNILLNHSFTPPVIDPAATSHIAMAEGKRQKLLDLIQTQFVEREHDAVKKRKDAIFEGDVDKDGHILSLDMMQTYISSYWYHQHAQLPILHKPTFRADKTPDLLLLAVISIGAATLDKAYGTVLTDLAAEFANFVIWHLRWEIIRIEDFRPPAKLWVLQTLLLIETYEKMYATRALHERAHIHHDSTLTLMRRGSSLIGRSASDLPPSLNPEKSSRPPGAKNSSHLQERKSEDSWMRWITTEATRRTAFGAFVLDSIHCTMFGHSAKMVAHELRMPLPCDEALWSATSPAEVARVQTSLHSNGIKPIMFVDGLKGTLDGLRVRTNSFGRTVIMAGLLSVSYHMAQRDLQVASIGPRGANSFGGPDKWKGTLLRAFDNWKRDFDQALAESAPIPMATTPIGAPSMHTLMPPFDDENIFESRTVLHHLAHIAAHVDVVDCQVFAGAKRLLSRNVTPKDFAVVREKIEKWATRATARDSAFYALKFLAQVLIPPGDGRQLNRPFYGHASPILPQAFERNQYIARDDFLLNRPWVLYVSALVVWCYGYALEGPIVPPPRAEDFETYERREGDMRDFLDRVAGVRAPDDLEHVPGKNRCLGLLLILRESFGSTRWELTHEAAGLLENAARKLQGHGGEDGSLHRPRAGHSDGTKIAPSDFTPATPGSAPPYSASSFNLARP